MRKRTLIALLSVLGTCDAAAQTEAEELLGWDGEIEFGFISTSGNAATSSTNAKLKTTLEQVNWRQNFDAQYLNASDDDGTTAERFVAEGSSHYKLNREGYLIVLNVRYVKDRFAGLDYRVSESVGYGHRFSWERARLDAEIGLGGRQTKFVDGSREAEGILRLAGRYALPFSETAEFRQELFTEIGEASTHSESETALRLQVNSHLATKLSYKIIHESDALAGTGSTDTIGAVTLIYGF